MTAASSMGEVFSIWKSLAKFIVWTYERVFRRTLQRCGHCKHVYYCGKTCQVCDQSCSNKCHEQISIFCLIEEGLASP